MILLQLLSTHSHKSMRCISRLFGLNVYLCIISVSLHQQYRLWHKRTRTLAKLQRKDENEKSYSIKCSTLLILTYVYMDLRRVAVRCSVAVASEQLAATVLHYYYHSIVITKMLNVKYMKISYHPNVPQNGCFVCIKLNDGKFHCLLVRGKLEFCIIYYNGEFPYGCHQCCRSTIKYVIHLTHGNCFFSIYPRFKFSCWHSTCSDDNIV